MTSSADVDTTGPLRRPQPVAPGASGRTPVGVEDRRAPDASTPLLRRFSERRLGPLVERSLDDSGVVLHHRLILADRPPVDHLLVAASGVWTVRAAHATGSLRYDRDAKSVTIHGDERSTVLPLTDREIDDRIRSTLEAIGYDWVEIRSAVCVTNMRTRHRRVDGNVITTPRRLITAALAPGALTPADVRTVASMLHDRFPSVVRN